jgi:hypothetical protein
MLNVCGIVATILKMSIGRKFSRPEINSGHHYLLAYQMLMTSDNVEFLPPIFYAVFWQSFWHISGTTGQNFMKLGGVIDICF